MILPMNCKYIAHGHFHLSSYVYHLSKFLCNRSILQFVRLGEHDLSTTYDGLHQDISIDRAVPHENYDPVMLYNDIAILYLERHVQFSGEFREWLTDL